MSKNSFLIVAAMIVASGAGAQQIPSSIPGSDGTYPLGQGNQGTLNCSDPLMAASSLCSGEQDSAGALRGGFGPSVTGSAFPYQTQNQVVTYTDEYGRPTSRERSTRIPLPPEPLTEFQKFTASTTGIVLPIFGADLFRNVPSTFAPVDNAPVPPEYIVGPDDMVRVRVWGQVNFNANLRVDRTGDIYLPQVGAVHVAGARFSDLDQMVRTAVSKIYRNFDLSVQLGDIRSIQIYVTGEARRPGVYTVSSLSTLVDALFSSGGPSVQGSMRHIELRRGGAVVTTFDLYRFLLAGDKTNDTKLLPGDVIHIPPVGPEIAVLGSVRRPAIYEVLPGATIGDAIKNAGDLTALASDARASLERTVERSSLQAMEVRLDGAGMATPVREGDILRVSSIVSQFQKTVTLRGNTANPGRFGWHDGMRLSELIPDKESLLTRDYWWKRVSLGLPAPEFQPVPALSVLQQPSNPVDLPLRQAMAQRWQNVQPPPVQRPYNQIGAANPTPYQQQVDSASLSDKTFFWELPEGTAPPSISPSAPSSGSSSAPSSSSSSASNQQSGQDVNAQRPAGPRGSESALAEQDMENQQPVNPQPGRRNVVALSVPEIDWSYAVIERIDPENLKTSLIAFDLGKLVLQHEASQDLELKPGDIVTVFSQADIHVPLSEQTTLVRLEGEFVHAGTYSARPGETLRALVQRAGGMTPNAYLYGSVFTRESTRILQQRRMDENVHAMILQMQRGNLALAGNPVTTSGELASASVAQTSGRELIAQLQQLRATGRIVFSFMPDSRGVDAIPDVPLENSDTFLVPSVPSTVNAVGAIFNQNSFLYRQDARLESYLQLAGGPNASADKKNMFLVRANGSVVSRESVKSAWGNEFMHLRLNPGDTIIVPDKTIKPSGLRQVLDWTQLFSQMAIGIAAFTVVF